MFGLFKRTALKEWELTLLKSVLIKLPVEYEIYLKQISEEIFKGVLIGYSDIPDYVAFSLNPEVYEKFYKPNGRNFKLQDIQFRDLNTNQIFNYSIFFSYGIINGYSIDKVPKSGFELEVDLTYLKTVNLDNVDYNKLAKILNSLEIKNINPADVYITNINGTEYFHLKELEDGDFIGMDENKNFYEITHDPFEIKQLKNYSL